MVPRLQSAGFVWRQDENINLVRNLHSRTVQCHHRRTATAERHPTGKTIDTTHGAAAFGHTAIPRCAERQRRQQGHHHGLLAAGT